MEWDRINLMKCTTLAYVGDAVFTLFIRTKFADPSVPSKTLMAKCSHIVSAVIQAKIFDALYGELSEAEQTLMNKCKNAHLNNCAKNATMLEYKKATALEGLLGALYISGDHARLNEILNRCLEIGNNE